MGDDNDLEHTEDNGCLPGADAAAVSDRALERGRKQLGALACAANYAWINRQVLLHQAREPFSRVLKKWPAEVDLRRVYDVCHNIAKIETHDVNGHSQPVCVHRKGATRAFPPGHPDLPNFCRTTGQPVLIPGDMGTASYVLVGGENALKDTFGSTCHGAGRVLSRRAAKKAARGRSLFSGGYHLGPFLKNTIYCLFLVDISQYVGLGS